MSTAARAGDDVAAQLFEGFLGDVLYREGDGNCDFFVILEGKVAVIEESSGEERVIGVHGPRRFLGELGLVTGQSVFVTAVVVEPGEVLVVAANRLREIVTGDQCWET